MRSMPRIPPVSGPPPSRFDAHTLTNSAHPLWLRSSNQCLQRRKHELRTATTHVSEL